MSRSRWSFGTCVAALVGLSAACKESQPPPNPMSRARGIEIRQDLEGFKRKLQPSVPVVSVCWCEVARNSPSNAPGPTDTVVYALLTFDRTGWQKLERFSMRRTGTLELPADIAQLLLPPTIHTIASGSSNVVIQGQLYDASSFGNIWYEASKGLQIGDTLFLSLSSR